MTVPGLSLDVVLKMTKIKSGLITDPDMYVFFEKRTRVEFLIFLIHIAKPTINITILFYDPKKESNHFVY